MQVTLLPASDANHLRPLLLVDTDVSVAAVEMAELCVIMQFASLHLAVTRPELLQPH